MTSMTGSCDFCDREISIFAEVCPHCHLSLTTFSAARPVKRRTWKCYGCGTEVPASRILCKCGFPELASPKKNGPTLPKRRGSPDDFQTPPDALKPLLSFLPKDKRIWEPACGRGNLVNTLQALGYSVCGTDKKTGTDFLDRDTWTSLKALGDLIVTNPPYSLKDEFLRQAYRLGLPFAFLLPLTALEGTERQSYYRRYGLELILLPGRLHFETPNRRPSDCWFPVAWFCSKLTGRALIVSPTSGVLPTAH